MDLYKYCDKSDKSPSFHIFKCAKCCDKSDKTPASVAG